MRSSDKLKVDVNLQDIEEVRQYIVDNRELLKRLVACVNFMLVDDIESKKFVCDTTPNIQMKIALKNYLELAISLSNGLSLKYLELYPEERQQPEKSKIILKPN